MRGGRHPRRSFIITSLLAFGLLGLVGRAEAAPIAAFTGNTFLDGGPGAVGGTISYAVFMSADFSADAAGILSSFVSGTGSGSLDLSAAVVYVFQIANNGFNNVPITGMSVGIPGVIAKSWGSFSHTVFVDTSAGGANVDATNNLGADETKPAGGSGPRTGVTSVGFAALSTAVDPTLVQMNAGIDVSNFFILPEVNAGQTSSLLVYTADELPTFLLAQVNDAGTSAFGPVPGPMEGLLMPVPEPGTLLLLGPGLIGLAAWPRWRRRPRRAERKE